MPKDLKGRKRPADVIGNALLVMKIATGEIDEPLTRASFTAVTTSNSFRSCPMPASI